MGYQIDFSAISKRILYDDGNIDEGMAIAMKHFRKILSLILAMIMFLSFLPVSVIADEMGSADDNGNTQEATVQSEVLTEELPVEPTAEPTQAPTSAPTAEPTQAPTSAPTPEPTQVPTSVPMDEATQAPTGVPTVEQTAEPTVVPSEEPAQGTDPDNDDETTATPLPDTKPTLEPTETTEAPAEPSQTEEPAVTPNEMVTTEPTVSSDSEPTPSPTAEPTPEPTPTVPTPQSPLAVTANTALLSVYANEQAVPVAVQVTGGVSPYSVNLQIQNGQTVVSESSITVANGGTIELSGMPSSFGVHSFIVTVIDALNTEATTSFTLPVAQRDAENSAQWEDSIHGITLNGDWSHDLPAVANTQLGYRESSKDFYIDASGEHHYSRYGDWYGNAYGDWAAMFVAFCFEYAQIPSSVAPRAETCASLLDQFRANGVYESASSGYLPAPGDLIFASAGSDNTLCAGIITSVTSDSIHAVFGDMGGCVASASYTRNAGSIIGYGKVAGLQANGDRQQEQAQQDIENVILYEETQNAAFTTKDNVNIRSAASTHSERLGSIKETGTELVVLGELTNAEGTLWYYVEYSDIKGFILGELLELNETNDAENTFAETISMVNPPMMMMAASPAAQNNIIIQLADAQALVCADVLVNVSIPGAQEYTVDIYSESGELLSIENRFLSEGSGTFYLWSEHPCKETIVVTAEVDGVSNVEQLEVEYVSYGQFTAAPVITTSGTPVAHQDFTVEWTPVQGADYYYLYWYAPDGLVVSGVLEEVSQVIYGSWIDTLGEYRLVVCALAAGYEPSAPAEAVFSVNDADIDERVSIIASRNEILYGDGVEITVSAPGAEAIRICYNLQGDRYYDEFEGEQACEEYWFRKDAVCYAEALYNDTWVASSSIEITVKSYGKLQAPQVSAAGEAVAGSEYTLTWTAVENAEDYYIYLRDRNGKWLENWYSAETSFTFPITVEEGSYILQVEPYTYGWDDSEATATLNLKVTGFLAPAPVLTASATDIPACTEITFTASASGADSIRVDYSDSSDNDLYDLVDGSVTFTRKFEYPQTVTVRAAALADGAWSAWSDEIEISVASLGTLQAPVLDMRTAYTAGESVEISWPAVENAEYYNVFLYDQNGERIDSWYVEDASFELPLMLEAGSYRVRVSAHAAGWEYAHSDADFSVEGALVEGPSFTMEPQTVFYGQPITFSVAMEGASHFRYLRDGQATDYEATDGQLSMTDEFYGIGREISIQFSACINGRWTAYGPAQSFVVEDLPMLGTTVVSVPENVHAGEAATITWQPVDNAQNYYVSIKTLDDQYVDSASITSPSCQYTVSAGELKQGTYQVKVEASGEGYRSSSSTSQWTVLAPLPGNEFRYSVSSDGTEVHVTEYLGNPVPAEVTIPETIDGLPVTEIGYECLANDGTLQTVTIPSSVTYISNSAFVGCDDLTIKGYTASEAEEYAIVNGHTFVALDDGEGDLTATWDTPVLVNTEMVFTVEAVGATEVRIYEDGYTGYGSTILLTAGGAQVYWTPDDVKAYCIRFEALVEGEWLTSKNYAVEVTSKGEMPKAENLVPSTTMAEPGTAITLSWDAPQGVTAAEYMAGVQSPSATNATWFYVTAGDTSINFSESYFREEGIYRLWVRVQPQPGYEPSETFCEIEIKSSKEWDFLPNRGEVIGYHGENLQVTVPAEIDGVPVQVLGREIFKDSSITSAQLPEGIRSIGSNAFENSASLESVILPSGLSTIDYAAFADCVSLTQVELPVSLQLLGSYAFEDCSSLTAISIPANVVTLNSSVFSGCSSLSQVTLPDSLSAIDSRAFANCEKLTAITIPQNVSSIHESAFDGCDDLTIYGYSGSVAEAFAQEQNIPFVVLDAAQTGDISFTLKKTTIYTYGSIEVSVTAPDAEKVRIHLNDDVYEYTMRNETQTFTFSALNPGERTITASQMVNGEWLAPCPIQTFAVIDLAKPVIEPIASFPAYSSAKVRWQSVEDAAYYKLRLTSGESYQKEYSDLTAIDEDGYVFLQLPAADVAHEGIYTVTVWAYAADGGYSSAERTFEATDVSDAFLYELNENGEAVVIGYVGGMEDVVVPELLDEHPVTIIAENAFTNNNAVSITLPSTVKTIENDAFNDCSQLQSVRFSDATVVVGYMAFDNCPVLMDIYAGAGTFAEFNAFDGCRTDTVVHGYSGGQLEEEAARTCTFDSLGELAQGPVILAEDIELGETMPYSVAYEGATQLYVKTINSEGYASGSHVLADQMEAEFAYGNADATEDFTCTIMASALVDGAWTAYSEVVVTVNVTGTLEAPVIHEMDALYRHLDHTLEWDAVEHAQQYHVQIYSDIALAWEETVDAPDTSVVLPAGVLIDGEYTLSVTATAAGYHDATATIGLAAISLKLETPEITAESLVARRLGTTVQWSASTDAERYAIKVTCDVDGETVIIYENDYIDDTQLELLPVDLVPGQYRISLIAHALYCISSDEATATFEVYQEKLETPVLEVEDRIPRHLGVDIGWDDIELAQQYIVTVTVSTPDGNTIVLYDAEEQDTTGLNILPADAPEGHYVIDVVAIAEYCTDSDAATADFEVYLVVLPEPVMTAPDEVVGGEVFVVSWESIPNAEQMIVEVVDAVGELKYQETLDSDQTTQRILLDEDLPIGTLVLRLRATAPYYTESMTEKEISYLPLYTYTIKDGNATITGYHGTAQNNPLYVPAQLGGCPVTAVGDEAFLNQSDLVSVYLPDSAQSIGAAAFKDCTALEQITGMGVTHIGREAFANCSSLVSVQFGSVDGYIVKAEENAFYNTPFEDSDPDGLLDIQIFVPGEYKNGLLIGYVEYMEGVTEIPARAHHNNLMLRTVKLPESLKTIGSEAFALCPALNEVALFDDVELIADDAFANSPQTHLTIYTGDLNEVSYVEQYAIDHQIPYTKVFHYDPDEEEDTSPIVCTYQEGTYGVEEEAWYGNTRLAEVNMPQTMEFIQNKAFADCGRLTTVRMYDGICDIAPDAFENSPNVNFIIYVEDMAAVSYVEQYAIDHGIPFQKFPKPVEPETIIKLDNDTASRITVPIDTNISIDVSDIPSDADVLKVYLDGEQIYATSISNSSSHHFSYVFRAFGEHEATAEAFANGESIKLSWKKPIEVVGIRLTADRTQAWTYEPVTFSVELYPEEDSLQLCAEDLPFADVVLENGVGTCTYPFTKAGDRQITARTNSGACSAVLQLTVMCLGRLEKPVLEAQAIQYLPDGLTCAWETTEHTDGYVLRVLTTNGQELISRRIADDGSERMSYTIGADELPAAGDYILHLMNYGYQYSQNESDAVPVLLTEDTTPVFTMDKQTALTGEPVVFTFRAFGASQVELWADGSPVEVVTLVDGLGMLTRSFTKSGERHMAIRALSADSWSELGEEQILTITSNGKLNDVVVEAESVQLLGNTISASWSMVENAEGYHVYFRNAQSETVYEIDTAETQISVPAAEVPEIGDYLFLVVAYGSGWDQSEGSATVTVANALPGPNIIVPAANEACTSLDVVAQWEAVSGAQSYVISLARKMDQIDENGQPIYEKVWAAPNETVDVGNALSYPLEGLAYGCSYRVAVGTVTTLQDGTSRTGWTERLFTVEAPSLSVTLNTETPTPAEKQQITLVAVANHALTQAVLTDETGAVVNVLSSSSEMVEGGRKFLFVVSEEKQCQKIYTVTVSGTETMAFVSPATAQLTVDWLDANRPSVTGVRMTPQSAWPGMDVSFTITANPHTTHLDVYWVNSEGTQLVETLAPLSSSADGNVFRYVRQFATDGEYTMQFTPLNADGEWSDAYLYQCTILPFGKLPAPAVTNLQSGDIIPSAGYTVQWEPVALGDGMFFDGYSITLEQWDESAGWKAMPDYADVDLGSANQYTLPVLTEGQQYRITVCTVPVGGNGADDELAGKTVVEFAYRTVPVFSLITVETNGILQKPVTVKWHAPVWTLAPSMQPDSYVVYWYRWDAQKQQTVQVHAETLDGKALQAQLPGDLVTESGNYTVDVYALLGAAQRLATGNNGFEISEPTVTLTAPTASKNTYLITDSLSVEGTAKGGIVRVLARLVGPDGKAVALVGADGAVVDFVVSYVQDNQFSVELDPQQLLIASNGDTLNYTVEVYGFLSEQEINVGTAAAKAGCMINIDDAEIHQLTMNHSQNNYWLFHDEWMTARVTTNRLVSNVMLYDNDQLLKTVFASEELSDGSRLFTSKAFNISKEGLHVVKACDVNDPACNKVMNVYVVTRLDEKETWYYTNTDSNLSIRRLPVSSSTNVTTITAPAEVCVVGIIGDYYMVVVNGKKGFVLSKELSKEQETQFDVGSWHYTITNNGSSIFVSTNQLPQIYGPYGRYMLVMAEGSPEADMTTIRFLSAESQLFTYNISTQSYSREFNFINDLRMEEGKTYHFVVVPEGTKQVVSFAMSHVYGFGKGQIIEPGEGDYLNVWTEDGLRIVWTPHSGANTYLVEAEMEVCQSDGKVRTVRLPQIWVDGNDAASFITATYENSIFEQYLSIDERAESQSISVRVSAY